MRCRIKPEDGSGQGRGNLNSRTKYSCVALQSRASLSVSVQKNDKKKKTVVVHKEYIFSNSIQDLWRRDEFRTGKSGFRGQVGGSEGPNKVVSVKAGEEGRTQETMRTECSWTHCVNVMTIVKRVAKRLRTWSISEFKIIRRVGCPRV